jgi:hypothetical protein
MMGQEWRFLQTLPSDRKQDRGRRSLIEEKAKALVAG